MRSYFRLLPLTMFCAFMLMAVKLGQTIESGESLFDQFFISSVSAQDAAEKTEGKPSEETKDAAKSDEAKKEDKADESKKDAAAKDDKKVEDKDAKKDEEKAKDEEGEGKKVAKKKDDKPYDPKDLIGNQLGGTRPDDRRFSPIELQLLQQLSTRRAELDGREKKIEIQESLLNQTENRVNEKFDEMSSLKVELAELIRRYNDIEETKVRSLVKIYENMKPKDAARIFNEVEMPILLMVIDQMSEKRAAPILANMNSKKAKQITVELAEQRRIQDEKIADQRAADQAAGAAGK